MMDKFDMMLFMADTFNQCKTDEEIEIHKKELKRLINVATEYVRNMRKIIEDDEGDE